jgi:hypothetical protein
VKQCVFDETSVLHPNSNLRIQLLKTNIYMGLCLYLSYLAVTKRLFLSQPGIKSITQFTSHLGSSQTLLDPLTGMESFRSHSFLSQKVCHKFFWLLPISDYITAVNKHQQKRPEYQCFVCQMYHMCLTQIFTPLRLGMTFLKVVRCPDSHFQRAIYSLGLYIADYPEQVWLAGIFQGWCPKYVSQL